MRRGERGSDLYARRHVDVTEHRSPIVTIGMPTYNRADTFLESALRSALHQTYENIGANQNYNYCLGEARGEYFCLLHDDDLIDPDFVQTCINRLDGDFDVGVVFTGNRLIDDNSKILHETLNRCGGLSTEEFLTGWFDGKVALYLCSTLFHTENLKKIGGFKSKRNLLDDVVPEILLAWHHGRVDVAEAKASFRRHGSNRGGGIETLKAWNEDCVYVYNLVCQLPAVHSRVFRKKALRYFSTKNYRMASRIPSLAERVSAYFMISKSFGHPYTPVAYFSASRIRPFYGRRVKLFVRRLKQVLKNLNPSRSRGAYSK